MNDLLLSFYSDDLTGGTDAMEALAGSGVRTALFFGAPSDADLLAVSGARAIGIAGNTRSLSPDAIESVLPSILERLDVLGPHLMHYKICSTFDSSPQRGSIGRAIETAMETLGLAYVPIVVGVPRLGRYTAFGTLFARAGGGGTVHRIDRHPTMSRHPATPMDEGDLRIHLARQTSLSAGLLDVSEMEAPAAELSRGLRRAVDLGHRIVLIDVLTNAHLERVGRLLWEGAEAGARFIVGSSGVEDALLAHWRGLGFPTGESLLDRLGPVDRLMVVSGSASTVSGTQIAFAVDHGFEELQIDPDQGFERATAHAVSALQQGKSVIAHTARGPGDPRLAGGLRESRTLGRALGAMLNEILLQVPLQRVVVAGGDTSTEIAQSLGIRFLEAIASAAPGAPVCRSFAPGTAVDGVEVVFKGGQMGAYDFYVDVRDGSFS